MPYRINKYILQKFLAIFTVSVAVFTLLFLMDQASRQVDQLAPHASSFFDFLVSFGLLSPPLLSYSIPLAFLMSMITTIEQMKQDRELTAILTAGISPVRLFTPFIAMSLTVFLITMGINVYLSPASYRAYNERITRMAEVSFLRDLKPGTFFKGIPGTVLLLREYDREKGRMEGLMMSMVRKDGTSDLVLASSGTIISPDQTGGEISLKLDSGTIHPMSAHRQFYRVGAFDQLESRVSVEADTDSGTIKKQILMAAGSDEIARWIIEARNNDAPDRIPPLTIEKHRRIALPLTVLLYPLIVFPIAISTGRRGKAFAFTASIFLFMLSLFLYSVGTRLGLNGIVEPALSAYLPILFLGAGALSVFVPFIWREHYLPGNTTPGSNV